MTEIEKEALLAERASLPSGTIVRRTIRGATRFYHQWRENNKTKSRYLSLDKLAILREQMNRRDEINRELATRKNLSSRKRETFNCSIARGERISELIASVAKFPIRDEVASANEKFIATRDKPILVIGPSRVGKTTFLIQLIASLSKSNRDKTSFISLNESDSLLAIREDLEKLLAIGEKFVAIDNLSRFREANALLTLIRDVYSRLGISFILTTRDCRDSRFEIIKLSHIATSKVIATAFATRDNAKEFCREQISSDAFDQLAIQTRNLLLEENSPFTRDELVANEWLLPCREELIAKTKKVSTIFLCRFSELRRVIGRDIIEKLLASETFANQGASEIKSARDTLLDSLEEKILEEQILLHFIATRDLSVSRVCALRFATGNRAIVIANRDDLTCQLFAVRNQDNRADAMLIDFIDPGKLDAIEHRFGLITSREIIYRGRTSHHPTGIVFRSLKEICNR